MKGTRARCKVGSLTTVWTATSSKRLELVDFVRRLLVWVCSAASVSPWPYLYLTRDMLLQRFNSRSRDTVPNTNCLASHLADLLELAKCADRRVRGAARPELAYAWHGEATLGVTALARIAAGACGEDRGLDVRKGLGRSEEDELVALVGG